MNSLSGSIAGRPKASMSAAAAVVLVLLVTGCATQVAGRYVWSVPEEQKVLILRPDHTFSFEASADVGGARWVVEGTWRQWDPARPEIIETHVTTVVAGDGRSHPRFMNERQLWRIGRNYATRWDELLAKE